jgi:maltodextrin utilization protein YvdJ
MFTKMNDTFTSILACVLPIVLILCVHAFLWLEKRSKPDELFPIAILCLGLPPLGVLILLLTFLDRYQRENEQLTHIKRN